MRIINILTKTIGRKIGLGFFAVIIVMAVIVTVTLSQVSTLGQINNRLVDLRIPTVQTSMTMINGINQSLAGLRGYMLLGTDKFKDERKSAWAQSLHRPFEAMQALSKTWTNPENVKRLEEIAELLPLFEQYQQEIEDITASDFETAKQWLGTKAAPTAFSIKALLEAMVENQQALVAQDADLAQAKQQQLVTLILILLGFGLVVAAAVAFATARHLVRPVQELVDQSGRVAQGDLSAQAAVKTQDEIGLLAESFNQMVGNIRETAERVEVEKTRAEQAMHQAEETAQRVQAQQHYLAQSVERMLHVMSRFAEGDLTVHLESEREDEIGQLFQGFNRAVLNIKQLFGQVRQAVASTTSVSTEISSAAEELAAGSQEQSAQASEVAAAVEEMARTIVENASNATQTAEVAARNNLAAREGGQVVVETVEKIRRIAGVVGESAQTIERLGRSSQQIGEIVSVIDDIADQTNLLALNAAIEAARAGEQGKGFAVVADEVRKLAERTTGATKQIATMIKTIQSETAEAVSAMQQGNEEVGSGITLADQAGASLERIVSETENTVDLINQIASASEEQSTTSEQISRSVEMISRVTGESAQGVGDIARSSDELNRLMADLSGLVAQFKTDAHDDKQLAGQPEDRPASSRAQKRIGRAVPS